MFLRTKRMKPRKTRRWQKGTGDQRVKLYVVESHRVAGRVCQKVVGYVGSFLEPGTVHGEAFPYARNWQIQWWAEHGDETIARIRSFAGDQADEVIGRLKEIIPPASAAELSDYEEEQRRFLEELKAAGKRW